MDNRRKFLVDLSLGATGLLAAGAAASAIAGTTQDSHKQAHGVQVFKSEDLHGPGQLPEAMVETSQGKTVQLYADLIRNKVVLINYMAIDNEKDFPVIAGLLEVTRHLKSKLGTDFHIVSITSDPVRDTPARLRAFAKRMGIPKHGWHFVRIPGKDSAIVSARLHRHPMAPDPRSRVGVVHYGNEPVGLWGVFPVGISPVDAAMRVTSVLPGKPVSGELRRAGPRKRDEAGLAFNNRIA